MKQYILSEFVFLLLLLDNGGCLLTSPLLLTFIYTCTETQSIAYYGFVCFSMFRAGHINAFFLVILFISIVSSVYISR